jgi:thiosulfate reductase cytochrome b subunit
MINSWGPDLNYTPDYWPLWFTVMAVVVLLALLGVLGHGLLRIIFSKEQEGAEHKYYLYTIPVRLWHWSNAILFIVLLFTGLLNHFGVGPSATMVKMHHFLGGVYVFCFIAFIFMGLLTGNIKQYVMELNGMFGRVFKQAMYYLIGILQNKPHPYEVNAETKFNPIQQVSYVVVMFMLVPAIIVSGVVTLYVKTPCGLVTHAILAICGLVFIIIHVYMCTTGDKPMSLIKGMIDGYHREREH